MTIRIIDIETTGIDPAKDRIVEIASVDASRGGSIPTNPMSHLVNPGMPIPAQASAVHHIVDADVIHAPVIGLVIDAFKGADVYAAHNASFEQAFLAPHIGTVKWLCTYRVALRLWPDLPSHSNQFLRYHFGYVRPYDTTPDLLVPHRALPDCYVTSCILHEILREAAEHAVPFSNMMAWSTEPPLMTTCRFGKHKGARYDAVPVDYLDWIADKSDMSADDKWCARYWRDKRKVTA